MVDSIHTCKWLVPRYQPCWHCNHIREGTIEPIRSQNGRCCPVHIIRTLQWRHTPVLIAIKTFLSSLLLLKASQLLIETTSDLKPPGSNDLTNPRSSHSCLSSLPGRASLRSLACSHCGGILYVLTWVQHLYRHLFLEPLRLSWIARNKSICSSHRGQPHLTELQCLSSYCLCSSTSRHSLSLSEAVGSKASC